MTRVASLNLCTDSMLFELIDPARIVSVTALSRDPDLSYFHREAAEVAVNHGNVEEILALAPELVVTGANTTPFAQRLLQRLGVPVINFEHADSFGDYRRNLLRLAAHVDARARAEALLGALQTVLDAPSPRPPRRALVYQPNGYTPGTATLMHDILRHAGMRDVAAELGLAAGGIVSLESLLLAAPDMVVFSTRHATRPSLAEAQLNHPALQRWFAAPGTVAAPRRTSIAENLWTCAGAFTAQAVTSLRRAGS